MGMAIFVGLERTKRNFIVENRGNGFGSSLLMESEKRKMRLFSMVKRNQRDEILVSGR
jgi:hypothetical protein